MMFITALQYLSAFRDARAIVFSRIRREKIRNRTLVICEKTSLQQHICFKRFEAFRVNFESTDAMAL